MRILANYFVNPLSVIIATLFTFINFLVILLPFYLLLIFFMTAAEDTQAVASSNNVFIYTLLFMFMLTIIYLYLDLIFGFTVKSIIKDCVDINSLDDTDLHKELFEDVLKEFDMEDVHFLFQANDEINAYAISTLRKEYVIVTTGMLEHIENSFSNPQEQKQALKGMIAHELSHLLNLDSLPNLILLSGQNIANYISKGLNLVLTYIALILSYIPATAIFALIFTVIFNLLTKGLDMVYIYILHPSYLFIERFLGRLNEYRSDYQSAEALSWKPIYFCLSSLIKLSGNTYHSNFSTHPNTISRMLLIYKVEKTELNITASFFSKYFSLLLLGIFSIALFYFSFNNIETINNFSKTIIISSTQFYEDTINFFIYIYKSYLYIPIIASIFIFALIIKIIKRVALARKIYKISENINTTQNTEIDFLLYYAVENNDIHSFLNILKYGANINSTLFEKDIELFSKEVNPEFIKHIHKIKK